MWGVEGLLKQLTRKKVGDVAAVVLWVCSGIFYTYLVFVVNGEHSEYYQKWFFCCHCLRNHRYFVKGKWMEWVWVLRWGSWELKYIFSSDSTFICISKVFAFSDYCLYHSRRVMGIKWMLTILFCSVIYHQGNFYGYNRNKTNCIKGHVHISREAYPMAYIDNTVPESIHSFPTKQCVV